MIKKNIALELVTLFGGRGTPSLFYMFHICISELSAMGSFYNEMITSEISFLKEEIQGLEIELKSRHSTPLVVPHARKQNLTQQTPRYITTTDQMRNQSNPIEHCRHLTSQRSLTDNLASSCGTANQCDT